MSQPLLIPLSVQEVFEREALELGKTMMIADYNGEGWTSPARGYIEWRQTQKLAEALGLDRAKLEREMERGRLQVKAGIA